MSSSSSSAASAVGR